MSVELLSNLTKTRNTVCRLNQITISVAGRNNLTVFKTTSIGSVLVKESRPPTSFRPARLALLFCLSCDDIGTPRLPNSTSYYDEAEKKSCSLLFSEQPKLDYENLITTENGYFAKSCCFSFVSRNYLRFEWWVSRVLPVCFVAWIS